jgi:hypothetical protein
MAYPWDVGQGTERLLRELQLQSSLGEWEPQQTDGPGDDQQCQGLDVM